MRRRLIAKGRGAEGDRSGGDDAHGSRASRTEHSRSSQAELTRSGQGERAGGAEGCTHALLSKVPIWPVSCGVWPMTT